MQAPALCETELVAVLVCLEQGAPHVFTLHDGAALPSGPLMPGQVSLQKSLREWVRQQTGIQPGHTEQLYTFADTQTEAGHRRVRISYMTCLRPAAKEAQAVPSARLFSLAEEKKTANALVSLYTYFPWEDRRNPAHADLLSPLLQALKRWAGSDTGRQQRCASTFGLAGHDWDDELALSRYELLWEAGLVHESAMEYEQTHIPSGMIMRHDYRHVLATALSRIRAKIRYTPIVFDLLATQFTLLNLQQAMEALAGRPMHKQNFRRLVLQQGLLEETPQMDFTGPGRPARLYGAGHRARDNCYLAGAKSPLPALAW